jgi:hypothetical protein
MKGDSNVTSQLFVDKLSGTFADPLLAFGLGHVARELLQRAYDDQYLSVRLHDQGGYYQLDLDAPLDDAALGRLSPPYMPIPTIVTLKNADKMPPDLPEQSMVQYEQERDKRAQFFKALKALSPTARKAWSKGEYSPETEHLQGLGIHADWDIFRAINPAALIGYNSLVTQWWQVQEALPDVVRLLRGLFSQTPNDLTAAEEAWKALDKARGWGISATTTAGQLFNPSQGKGQNRPKPDRLSMGNVKAFWLLEWLKAVGFYRAALTKQPRKSKDRKTYVLVPIELGLTEHEKIFQDFREAMQVSQTAILSDVLVSLRYTRLLLSYALAEDAQDLFSRLMQVNRPANLVAGFASAFYKNLGSSTATMGLPFIGLPGWLRVGSAEEVRSALEVLAEHEQIVRQFDESHGDDYELLSAYRDFCSGEDLEAFWQFIVPYSGYLIGRRERNQYARQFSEENLRRLIMGSDPKLEPILDTPGFQHIAYAIRQSTVTAQFRKKKLNDRRYDVRYGLGQQLARKSRYASEFIAELSDFLQKYNAENAQVMETRPGPYRRSVKTSDIDDIVRLIDEYDARTICNLLIAYGYARTSREGEPQDAPEEPEAVPDDEVAVEGNEDDQEEDFEE